MKQTKSYLLKQYNHFDEQYWDATDRLRKLKEEFERTQRLLTTATTDCELFKSKRNEFAQMLKEMDEKIEGVYIMK